MPSEPRLMADGRTLIANTFNCGLYQVHDVANDPRISHLYSFAMNHEQAMCALPVTFGRLWVQTVPTRRGLVALDLSDPGNPKEVGHVDLGEDQVPHWISLEPNGERIVVTGFGRLLNRVAMVDLDPKSGALSVDTAFGIEGVVNFGRSDWPPTGLEPATR
jgi:hypothetical protein